MSSNQDAIVRRWALPTNERVILCCSSTRHRRYVDNLVSVMSLPSGSRVRLRYGEDVCDPEVRKIGQDAAPLLVGTRALIARVSFEQSPTEILPLRIGSIVELRTLGSVTFLEIELGDFVEVQPCINFAENISALAKLELPVVKNKGEKPVGIFCQFLKYPPALTSSQDAGLWERVATQFLASMNRSLVELPFIFHVEIVNKRSRIAVPMHAGTLIVPAISQIEIRFRTLVTQALFDSIIDNPVGALILAVNHPNGQIASGTQHPIDTSRDLLVSWLNTSISLRPAYGSIALTAQFCALPAIKSEDRADGPTPRSADSVTIEMPVSVGRPSTRLLAITLIASALAAHAFDIGQLSAQGIFVWGKAIAVFVVAFLALSMGLKPQSGN